MRDYSCSDKRGGIIHVVDPSPLNWFYVLLNTMEEAVRASRTGRIIPSLASKFVWINDTTLELNLREGVYYHNGSRFTSENVRQNFNEVKRWIAPHPPGTWLNLPQGSSLEVLDSYTVRIHLSKPDGLSPGKLRAHHFANNLFWQTIGFGYVKLGSAEGHW